MHRDGDQLTGTIDATYTNFRYPLMYLFEVVHRQGGRALLPGLAPDLSNQPCTDLQAELRAIDIPTLVVHGDADASAPIDVTGRPTSPLLPNSRLEIYAGAPHGPYVTEKDRLDKELHAFAAAL